MELTQYQVVGTTKSYGKDEIALVAGDRFRILVNPKVGDTYDILNRVVPAGKQWRIRIEVDVVESAAE